MCWLEKGGINKERFVEFLKMFVFDKYKNHLIVLDNAWSHRNNYVKEEILNSGNKYLFSIPYTPETNPIEALFNQLKYYLKLNKKVLKFEGIKIEIRNAFKKIIRITFYTHLTKKN